MGESRVVSIEQDGPVVLSTTEQVDLLSYRDGWYEVMVLVRSHLRTLGLADSYPVEIGCRPLRVFDTTLVPLRVHIDYRAHRSPPPLRPDPVDADETGRTDPVDQLVAGMGPAVEESMQGPPGVNHWSFGLAEPTCTALTASWCPIHGDCSCPRDDMTPGVWVQSLDDPGCPLHAPGSDHPVTPPLPALLERLPAWPTPEWSSIPLGFQWRHVVVAALAGAAGGSLGVLLTRAVVG